jgi:hypothetical protein
MIRDTSWLQLDCWTVDQRQGSVGDEEQLL